MKTSDLFQEKTVLSFEIFPPKPTSDERVIYETLNGLSDLQPDFISVTYGAGGGKNGSKTIQITSDVKKKYGIESVAHLPCINLSEQDAVEILDSMQANGIENILALRGDISPDTKPGGRFYHANDLISFIHERYDFNIIAACYPEGHSESKSIIEDMNYLKHKVHIPIEAGIMPVTNKSQIERMVKLCGIHLPQKFMKVMERYENNPVALRDAGIAYATDQIVDLIAQGVDGIHLYTMNNPYVAKRIYEAVHSLIAVQHC